MQSDVMTAPAATVTNSPSAPAPNAEAHSFRLREDIRRALVLAAKAGYGAKLAKLIDGLDVAVDNFTGEEVIEDSEPDEKQKPLLADGAMERCRT